MRLQLKITKQTFYSIFQNRFYALNLKQKLQGNRIVKRKKNSKVLLAWSLLWPQVWISLKRRPLDSCQVYMY